MCSYVYLHVLWLALVKSLKVRPLQHVHLSPTYTIPTTDVITPHTHVHMHMCSPSSLADVISVWSPQASCDLSRATSKLRDWPELGLFTTLVHN